MSSVLKASQATSRNRPNPGTDGNAAPTETTKMSPNHPSPRINFGLRRHIHSARIRSEQFEIESRTSSRICQGARSGNRQRLSLLKSFQKPDLNVSILLQVPNLASSQVSSIAPEVCFCMARREYCACRRPSGIAKRPPVRGALGTSFLGLRQASALGGCRIYREAVRELSPGWSVAEPWVCEQKNAPL
jgi:hypothetical protein